MTQSAEIEDFASAAMMRLVAAGLARQGIEARVEPSSNARVPRGRKRDLLEAVMTEQGPLAILRIADAAPDMPPEPIVQAVLKARDIDDLMDRWRRLQRFGHSRHEVTVERLGDGAFRLRHRTRDGGPPPSGAESLLVLALITVLAELVSQGPASLRSEAGAVWRHDGNWLEAAGPYGGCAVILECSARRTPTLRPKDETEVSVVARLRRCISDDPLRRWNVAELASCLGLSPRSLQRRLAAKQTTVSGIVSAVRLQTAAQFLCDGSGPRLAEVGFLSGYSDQAHFTRSFVKAVGTTPRAYRSDFSS